MIQRVLDDAIANLISRQLSDGETMLEMEEIDLPKISDFLESSQGLQRIGFI